MQPMSKERYAQNPLDSLNLSCPNRLPNLEYFLKIFNFQPYVVISIYSYRSGRIQKKAKKTKIHNIPCMYIRDRSVLRDRCPPNTYILSGYAWCGGNYTQSFTDHFPFFFCFFFEFHGLYISISTFFFRR